MNLEPKRNQAVSSNYSKKLVKLLLSYPRKRITRIGVNKRSVEYNTVIISTLLLLTCFFSPLISQEGFAEKNNPAFNSYLLQNNNQSGSHAKLDGKNVLYSLIIPGLGQWIGGERGRAKVFFGVDIVLWAGFFGSKAYTNTLENDFQTYAAIHAGVNTSSKDEQYWIDIGNANNIYQFNEKRRVQRNLNATYPEISEFIWQWDEETNRENYAELRSKQRSWESTTSIFVAGLILNRIVSAVDVIRIIRKQKKSENDLSLSYFHLDYRNNYAQGDTYRLNFTWNF